MTTMATRTSLTPEQIASYNKDGFLVLHDLLSPAETKELISWSREVHDWPNTADTPWMPYEEVDANGKRVICRTENFASSHAGFNNLLRGKRMTDILEQLSGEPMHLFKEKINFKLPGAGGFAPHVDSVAYIRLPKTTHLAILMAVDPATQVNGGLEVVVGSHLMDVPTEEATNCLNEDWVKSQTWTPIDLQPGEALIFGTHLAHRSGPNRSEIPRHAVYATYNPVKDGDLHDKYYEDRERMYPSTHRRKPDVDYTSGEAQYAFGSPLLSINGGKQLIFH